ncbi:hypothetical protein [Geotalea toluenoxydans]|uniref:hypothetical protein n=1 Tax=Geotalea toluenoxydans TaxID=421624 RepID=UPI001FB2F7A9|nr:hypothetical protein [Geotalea toluenoxydans]
MLLFLPALFLVLGLQSLDVCYDLPAVQPLALTFLMYASVMGARSAAICFCSGTGSWIT